jgi:hypothetical protein
MRLLEINSQGEFSLTYFISRYRTPYAILSHTWGAEEVTFQDLRNGLGKIESGYNKILFCGEQARLDGLQYFWVDTCCIDKSSGVELSEAINSMFQWYQNASKCYAYLSDVSTTPPLNTLDKLRKQSVFDLLLNSRWFTRGWTLPELLAPKSLEFFSKEGEKLGDKKSLDGHKRD